MECFKFFGYFALCMFSAMYVDANDFHMLAKKHGLTHQELEAAASEFNSFVETYSKQYESEHERTHRFDIFLENKRKIKSIQAMNPEAQYGITKFSDLSQEEFKKLFLTFKMRNDTDDDDDDNSDSGSTYTMEEAEIPDVKLPNDFNWLGQGVVSRVKDQGNCGSCFAFSAVGNIESMLAIKYGKLQRLSEQEVVDCDVYDDGCDGGDMANVYRWVYENDGLVDEEEYPYNGTQQECKVDNSTDSTTYTISNKGVKLSEDEDDIAKYVYQKGPVAVALNALWLQFYERGILDIANLLCWPDYLDHAALLVGFGKDRSQDGKKKRFWIVKNSWGQDWGEEGFFRIAKGKGTCGVNKYVVSATV